VRIAVVDIGSNTVRLVIYDIYDAPGALSPAGAGAQRRVILREKEALGLVNFVRKGVMADEGVHKLIRVLNNYRVTAAWVACERFCCFATASLRNIINTQDVMGRIKAETGLDIDLIAGEDEALLGFYGMEDAMRAKDGFYIDMGGSSTELLGFRGSAPVKAVSVPFGSLQLFKKFVRKIIPRRAELRRIDRYVRDKLEGLDWLGDFGGDAYMVGGVSRAIVKLHNGIYHTEFDEEGFCCTVERFEEIYKFITKPGDARIRCMIREIPDRLHNAIPGLCAMRAVLQAAGIKTLHVSSAGIREGYLIRRVLGK